MKIYSSALSELYWFPRTKLAPPQLRKALYFRPGLVTSLQHAIRSSRVTLIAAPAGSGKTTLLAHLVNTEPDFPLASITLGAEDNDPVTILELVVSSLQGIFPSFGASIQALFGCRSEAGNPYSDILASKLLMIGDWPAWRQT